MIPVQTLHLVLLENVWLMDLELQGNREPKEQMVSKPSRTISTTLAAGYARRIGPRWCTCVGVFSAQRDAAGLRAAQAPRSTRSTATARFRGSCGSCCCDTLSAASAYGAVTCSGPCTVEFGLRTKTSDSGPQHTFG